MIPAINYLCSTSFTSYWSWKKWLLYYIMKESFLCVISPMSYEIFGIRIYYTTKTSTDKWMFYVKKQTKQDSNVIFLSSATLHTFPHHYSPSSSILSWCMRIFITAVHIKDHPQTHGSTWWMFLIKTLNLKEHLLFR